MIPSVGRKTAGEMMSAIMVTVGTLVRNEAGLSRPEIITSPSKAGGALGGMGFAMVLTLAGLNVLAAALTALAIGQRIAPLWASVVVGLGLLFIPLWIILAARTALTQNGFLPTRATRSLQRDATAIKEAHDDKCYPQHRRY